MKNAVSYIIPTKDYVEIFKILLVTIIAILQNLTSSSIFLNLITKKVVLKWGE